MLGRVACLRLDARLPVGRRLLGYFKTDGYANAASQDEYGKVGI